MPITGTQKPPSESDRLVRLGCPDLDPQLPLPGDVHNPGSVTRSGVAFVDSANGTNKAHDATQGQGSGGNRPASGAATSTGSIGMVHRRFLWEPCGEMTWHPRSRFGRVVTERLEWVSFSMRLRLLCALALMGCQGPTGPVGPAGKDGEMIPPPNVFGTYDLTSVNGKPLPYTLAEGSTSKTVIASGAVSLNANGSYVRSTTSLTITGADTTSQVATAAGNFTANSDGAVAFSGAVPLSAVVFRNTMTLNVVGAETWVYRR